MGPYSRINGVDMNNFIELLMISEVELWDDVVIPVANYKLSHTSNTSSFESNLVPEQSMELTLLETGFW